MTTIQIKIKNCSECPFFTSTRELTGDSFENVQKWSCRKMSNKRIATLETFDKEPKVPDWCPIKV